MAAKAKKTEEIQNGDIKSNIIVLRSAWGKVGQKYYIQPARDKHGRYADCVRKVDANGDMILSMEDKENDGKTIHLIPESETFIVEDGKTYDLDDIYQRCEWEAIKNSILISPDRYAKNENGEYIMGTTSGNVKGSNNQRITRMGAAELYIDRPGYNSQIKVTRKKLILKASNYVMNDSYDQKLLIVKVLGRNMSDMPNADVEEYLLSVAEDKPEKIISIYEGGDLSYHALFIDALEKHTIRKVKGLYVYGEDDKTVLGATKESAISWLKSPKNATIVSLLRRDTFPELYANDNLDK